MNLDEKKFIKHLNELEVETLGLSFDWMLEEDDHGLLHWIYKYVNESNALTSTELYRFADLESNDILMSSEETEEYLNHILQKYDGFILPGDKDGCEKNKRYRRQLQERLNLLNAQEKNLDKLISQNELAKADVNEQLSKLQDDEVKATVETKTAESESLKLAEDIENKVDEFVMKITTNLDFYRSLHSDQNVADQFLVSGPIEKYIQNRRLFQSHFKLYTTRQFDEAAKVTAEFRNMSNESNKEDSFDVAVQLKNLRGRLKQGLWAYMESVADFTAELKMLEMASNYKDVHTCQLPILTAECSSNIEMLKQDIAVLRQEQLSFAVQALVEEHCTRARTAEGVLRLQERKDLFGKLCALHSQLQGVCNIDHLLYFSLRRELVCAEDFVQFCSDVKEYLEEEHFCVQTRLDAMKAIQAEHDMNSTHPEDGNFLIRTLEELYGIQGDVSLLELSKHVDALKSQAAELREDVFVSGVQLKLGYLEKSNEARERSSAYISDGCTGQPQVSNQKLVSLFHKANKEAARVEVMVGDAVQQYTNVGRSKDILPKLWLWFLTNPNKLLTSLQDALDKRPPPPRPFKS